MSDRKSIHSNFTSHRQDNSILEPFLYLNSVPGKDVRGCLMDCFQDWLQIPHEKLEIIKEIIASLHNASLLIDDIEDNSKLRRGVPVAHSIFGIATTINCANYVYFLALEKCHSLENPSAMSIFVQEMLNLHRGQGQDILWRDAGQCPTEDQYKQMVKDKTGGLFRLSVGLMQCFSDMRQDFTTLLDLLGLYFQIRDDYLNISNSTYMQTKSFCEDISEGKFSFPIIHAIHSNSQDKRLINILKQKTEDVKLKQYAVQYMYSCGSLAYTRQTLCNLFDALQLEIQALGGHSKLLGLLITLESQLESLSPRNRPNMNNISSAEADLQDLGSIVDRDFVDENTIISTL